jgi:hypothetical protein
LGSAKQHYLQLALSLQHLPRPYGCDQLAAELHDTKTTFRANAASMREHSRCFFMRTHRVWIEITVLGTATACGLAVLLAVLGAAGTGAASDALEGARPLNAMSQEQSYEGMVTCSRCGAKHSAALDRPATVCVRVCVHGGATFALINSDTTYFLEGDLDGLKRVAGQRARVAGHLNGNTIQVASVVPEG